MNILLISVILTGYFNLYSTLPSMPSELCDHIDNYPENCSFGMCQKVDGYPRNKIKRLLEGKNEFDHFNGLTLQTDPNCTSEFKNMCETRIFRIRPESALNLDNERAIIVNIGLFVQAVTMVKCLNLREELRNSEDILLPIGHEAKCVQQYSIIKLVTLTKSGNLKLDQFAVPSGCAYSFRKVY